MNSMSLFDKHIELIEAVNNSTVEHEHVLAKQRLNGFRDALEIIEVDHLCDCDNFYLNDQAKGLRE